MGMKFQYKEENLSWPIFYLSGMSGLGGKQVIALMDCEDHNKLK